MLLIGTSALGQEDPNDQLAPKSLDSEIEAVASDLANYKDLSTQPFLRYFTAYAVPEEIKKHIGQDLSFTLHSLSSERVIRPPVALSDTLYRIDLRDYGWTIQSWEDVYKIEPYIKFPWIDLGNKHKHYDYIRNIAGNALLRADWFIVNALDQTRQADRKIDTRVYPTLLYASREGGEPKTLEDLRQFWGIDRKQIDKLKLAKGGVVAKGDSAVAHYNRTLYITRTLTGYWTETYDSANIDYIEELLGENSKRDAGEAFGSNFIGLQIYALFNQEEKFIDFGDPTFVRDRLDPSDVRVRMVWSCIRCHHDGVNPINNRIHNMINKGVKILVNYDHNLALDIERFYLSDLDAITKEYQEPYIRAVKAVTGGTTDENIRNLSSVFSWYDKKIDIEQAALECGVSINEYKSKLNNTTAGRLVDQIMDGNVDRYAWDLINIGVFTKAMLHIHNLQNTEPVFDPTKYSQYPMNSNLFYKDIGFFYAKSGEFVPVLKDEETWKIATDLHGNTGDWLPITLDGKKKIFKMGNNAQNIDKQKVIDHLMKKGVI